MTNQFTDEQAEAGALAAANVRRARYGEWPLRELGEDSPSQYVHDEVRAALEAAAGVAPQAGSENVEAVGALNAALTSYSTGALLEVEYRNAALLARRALLAPTRVQPSSTVDEGKIAEVIASDPGLEAVFSTDALRVTVAPRIARAVVEAIGGEGL